MNSPPHSAPAACRACGGGTTEAFEGVVLDHVTARYDRCLVCASLQVVSPYWLDEAYDRKFAVDPDQGALRRTLFIHRCIRRLRSRRIRWIQTNCRSLDYGSGRGLLLRMLLDDGHDAWGYDPYPGAILGEDHVLREQPISRYDLIVLAEVIEHLVDPDAVLSKLRSCLSSSGLLLISTELYKAHEHGPSWPYLAPAHGQHIQFYSHAGLNAIMARNGFESWGCLPFGDFLSKKPRLIDFVHLYALPGKRRRFASEFLLRRRHHRGESRHAEDHLS